MTSNALKEIAALPALSRDELKQIWKDLFESTPGNCSNEFMIRRIAWRMQEMQYGGLSSVTKDKIKKLQKKSKNIRKRKDSMPPPGTMLTREHGGQEHRVMILADGFEYRGCKYKSLTEIATKITGTKWSGPRFFGLTGLKK
ncbi:MAG: DUF2924 domain-containing protein [Micavibrio sp.]|nr:DUF2924 domain-containing protein [Micavibrio sp.]